jgi:hypothetical protein
MSLLSYIKHYKHMYIMFVVFLMLHMMCSHMSDRRLLKRATKTNKADTVKTHGNTTYIIYRT